MRLILILFVLVLSTTVYSQDKDFEKPDYEQIEKNVKDEKSNLYYPVLLERYNSGDSTITLEERRHLYYGFTFHENYSPYGESDNFDRLKAVFNNRRLVDNDYKLVSALCDSILFVNPFDVRAINYKLYSTEKLKDSAAFNINMLKLRAIVAALLSSGDGFSESTAYYVISTTHEYALLKVLGLEFGGQQNLIEQCDYLELKENTLGIKGLYFDVSPCLNYLRKSFKK